MTWWLHALAPAAGADARAVTVNILGKLGGLMPTLRVEHSIANYDAWSAHSIAILLIARVTG